MGTSSHVRGFSGKVYLILRRLNVSACPARNLACYINSPGPWEATSMVSYQSQEAYE